MRRITWPSCRWTRPRSGANFPPVLRGSFKENDKDLAEGTAALEGTLEKLSKLKQVLDTTARLVEIIARVVAFL